MKGLLITGASGLLGSNLALAFVNHFKIFAAYHQHRLQGSQGHIFAFEADLTQRDEVIPAIQYLQPSWIIHCAALTGVDYCELHPEEARQVNVIATQNISEAATSAGARLIYISTDSVFDGRRGNYCEEDQPNPLNEYARTKLAGEQVVRNTTPDALIIRTAIYGWNMQEKQSLAEWILDQLEQVKPVNGFQDVYFSPILVNDLADIILQAIRARIFGLYHVGGAERCNKFEFACHLATVFGLKSELVCPGSISASSLVAPRPLDISLDSSKIMRDLGIELPNATQGLKRFKLLRDSGYVKKLKALGV